MTSRVLCATLLLCFAQAAFAADEPADEIDTDDAPAASSRTRVAPPAPPELADFCFIAMTPAPGTYTVIRPIKVGKNTYGKIWDILPAFAARAKRLGADAVIEYDGAQRFGFFPWRVVRPVVHGVAIKWLQAPVSCAAAGGSTLQTIMATDTRPSTAPLSEREAASAPAP